MHSTDSFVAGLCARILITLFALSGAAAFAASSDGPYLISDGHGQWIARWVDSNGQAGSAREQRLKVGQQFSIPAVGRCPAFKVRVRKPEAPAPEQVSFASSVPLLIIADTHGEHEILCEFLQRQRVVDSSLHWAFGRGHLIVLGDIFDRGPNQTEILWWLYQLQSEAQRAGGGLHVVLGNHEVMALRGDARYLNPKYVDTTAALGLRSYSELFGPETLLGQWLRTKPAVLKANSVLCLHGGISREMVDRGFSLSEINANVRAVLARPADAAQELSERETITLGKLGPLWYRGYFADQTDFPTATDDDVDHILKAFEVDKIAVGHTIVPTVTPLYHNKVLAVQVYPHRDETSGAAVLEGAILDKGVWSRAQIDGARTPL